MSEFNVLCDKTDCGNTIVIGRLITLFDLTASAYQILINAINKESEEGENLFVRLTMGIG